MRGFRPLARTVQHAENLHGTADIAVDNDIGRADDDKLSRLRYASRSTHAGMPRKPHDAFFNTVDET